MIRSPARAITGLINADGKISISPFPVESMVLFLSQIIFMRLTPACAGNVIRAGFWWVGYLVSRPIEGFFKSFIVVAYC